MISFNSQISAFVSQAFPISFFIFTPISLINETLICPFWDDVDTAGGTRGQIYFQNNAASSSTRQNVMELIEESFGYRFIPTGVYIATWDHVHSYGGYIDVST